MQCNAMQLSDWKGCSQAPLLPRPHLRVGSGGKGILLEIPTYLRPSEGKQLISFISMPTAVAFEQILTCCSLGPCCSAVVAVLSIVLQSIYFSIVHVEVALLQLPVIVSFKFVSCYPFASWF